MRVHFHRSPSGLAGILFVLFIALSFNAYACLLPVNGVTAAAMGNGCSTPDEQPVNQYCDAVKTLDVQSADTHHLNRDCQTIYSEDAASSEYLGILTLPSNRLSDPATVGPSQDTVPK